MKLAISSVFFNRHHLVEQKVVCGDITIIVCVRDGKIKDEAKTKIRHKVFLQLR